MNGMPKMLKICGPGSREPSPSPNGPIWCDALNGTSGVVVPGMKMLIN
jgi:hypothetical protein